MLDSEIYSHWRHINAWNANVRHTPTLKVTSAVDQSISREKLYTHTYNQLDTLSTGIPANINQDSDPKGRVLDADPDGLEEVPMNSKNLCFIDELSPLGKVPVYTTDKELIDEIYYIGKHPDMTPAGRLALIDLLRKNRSCFAVSLDQLSTYCGPEGDVKINLKPGFDRCFKKPRRMNAFEEEAIQDAFPKLAKLGIIQRQHETDRWASNVVVAHKRNPLTKLFTDRRVCINYAPINAGIEPEVQFRFDSPVTLHDRVSGSKWMSLCDMRSAFHSIKLDEASQALTSFWWQRSSEGLSTKLWCFNRLP